MKALSSLRHGAAAPAATPRPSAPASAGAPARAAAGLKRGSLVGDACLTARLLGSSPASLARQRSKAPVVSALAVETSSCLADEVRKDFPILDQECNGRPLIYFDNAATSQKPQQVLDALGNYYSGYNSNVHRGVHMLSAKATDAYEAARGKVAKFINAASDREIVYTRNASEAINLVAYTWGLANLGEGDEVILSVAEHHSNLVPWQIVAQKTGAVLRFVELKDGALDMEQMESLVCDKTKLISVVHVSNVLGGVLPVPEVVAMAQKVGAKILLDACQSVPHMQVDVQALGVDWIVASGHKSIGFLWGTKEALESMPPFMGGGEMIADVFLDHSTYAPPPARFEAGTPAIGEAIGLGAACDYLSGLGMDRVHAYEEEIGGYLWEKMKGIEGVELYGPPPTAPGGRASLASFNVEGLHATDVSTILDQSGVAVRSGHHCTQPLHRYLDVSASARASLYIYNTRDEVDRYVESLQETIAFFREINGNA